MSSSPNDIRNAIDFRRPFNWQRTVWHITFWSLIFWLTLTQFKRAFADKPNDQLLYIVNTHHFLTTIVSFLLLGYMAIPATMYKPRTVWNRALLIAGVIALYYGVLCVNTYALLVYLHDWYAPLPKYLDRRVSLFLDANWYDFLINPSILFFIFGQFTSYLLTPLLIKAVRDAYARGQAQLTSEKELKRVEVSNIALEKGLLLPTGQIYTLSN